MSIRSLHAENNNFVALRKLDKEELWGLTKVTVTVLAGVVLGFVVKSCVSTAEIGSAQDLTENRTAAGIGFFVGLTACKFFGFIR
ncbi:MAG: hypothetical protein MRY21_04440 [Simkaniaceae bacterium]|nr:hypothetical protein [Simkaniaceae bacterium]